ncbi:MAG: hypothetical protein R6U37_09045 [Dehalococcoidia bacterium]
MDEEKTRQERREERERKKRQKMRQHGKGLARIYRNAVLKRLRHKSSDKGGSDDETAR